jgi:hypothetical protein
MLLSPTSFPPRQSKGGPSPSYSSCPPPRKLCLSRTCSCTLPPLPHTACPCMPAFSAALPCPLLCCSTHTTRHCSLPAMAVAAPSTHSLCLAGPNKQQHMVQAAPPSVLRPPSKQWWQQPRHGEARGRASKYIEALAAQLPIPPTSLLRPPHKQQASQFLYPGPSIGSSLCYQPRPCANDTHSTTAGL